MGWKGTFEAPFFFLDQLGGIPSGEIINYSYLKKIASLKKPVILSTGMSTEE